MIVVVGLAAASSGTSVLGSGVHRSIPVDGVTRDLSQVLPDPEFAPLLSDGGVIEEPRYSVVRPSEWPTIEER